ncbi:MAG TPA: PTS transporter subunit EIIB, partial [Allocoleopsis sp.]
TNGAVIDSAMSAVDPDPQATRKVEDMIIALGGRRNIRNVDAAALTRLRLEVNEDSAVNEAALQEAGVEGVMHLPDHKYHLVVGLNAEQYANEMKRQLTAVG